MKLPSVGLWLNASKPESMLKSSVLMMIKRNNSLRAKFILRVLRSGQIVLVIGLESNFNYHLRKSFVDDLIEERVL